MHEALDLIPNTTPKNKKADISSILEYIEIAVKKHKFS
jgi:hypothetical protein